MLIINAVDEIGEKPYFGVKQFRLIFFQVRHVNLFHPWPSLPLLVDSNLFSVCLPQQRNILRLSFYLTAIFYVTKTTHDAASFKELLCTVLKT